MDNEEFQARESASKNGLETRQVVVKVIATIPEFHQVIVRDGTGRQFAITRRTNGIDWTKLYEGQRLQCTVTVKLPRVLYAVAL